MPHHVLWPCRSSWQEPHVQSFWAIWTKKPRGNDNFYWEIVEVGMKGLEAAIREANAFPPWEQILAFLPHFLSQGHVLNVARFSQALSSQI